MGSRRGNIVPVFYTPPDDETPQQSIVFNRRLLSEPNNINSATPYQSYIYET